MGMWTTENQDTMAESLREFRAVAREAFDGSTAYEAGYLHSTVISMLRHLPKREQKALIEEFNRTTQRLRLRVAELKKEVDQG